MLKTYSDKIIISYDSDGAGQAATLRGLEILVNIGCDVRILQMQGAKDPDEFVIKYGNAKFNLLIQNAISLVEFKIKVLKKDLDLQNVNDKIKFLKETANVLSKIESKIEQELYISKIATEYDISKEAIYAEINKLSLKTQNATILEKPKQIAKIKTEKKTISETEANRENIIISLLLKNGIATYNIIKGKILIEDFKSEENKAIVRKLFEEFENDIQEINVLNLFEEEELINKITEILSNDYDLQDEKKSLNDIINIYEKDRLTNRRNEIIEQIATGNVDNIEKLESELQEILKKLTPKK